MNQFMKDAKRFDIAHEIVDITSIKVETSEPEESERLTLKEDALIRAIIR